MLFLAINRKIVIFNSLFLLYIYFLAIKLPIYVINTAVLIINVITFVRVIAQCKKAII